MEDVQPSTLPWVERYRPRCLEDVVSHHAITQTLDRFLANQQILHLLFHGPPGTGKTSVAQAIARKLYGPHTRHMVLELNASDDRGILVVRETIKQFAETRPNRPDIPPADGAAASTRAFLGPVEDFQSGCAVANPETAALPSSTYTKLIILDEADQMTAAAQMALRRIIENYAKFVRFIIICNYVNKINPALQSRCTKFRFPPLKKEAIRDRTRHICEAEGIHLTDQAMETLLRIGGGDMRKVLNCLQSAAMGNENKVLTEEVLLETVGRPSSQQIDKLIPQLASGSLKSAFGVLETLLKQDGFALSDIIIELYERMLQYDLPVSTTCAFYPRLADIQYRLARGADETTQAADVVAVFISIRKELARFVSHNPTQNGVAV